MNSARRFLISGRVQGVGYRAFAKHAARELAIAGYAGNLADGSVEVHAEGSEAALVKFAGRLRQGPRWGEVRHVEEREASPSGYDSFSIR